MSDLPEFIDVPRLMAAMSNGYSDQYRREQADRLEQAIRGWARNRMREPLREIIEEALRG